MKKTIFVLFLILFAFPLGVLWQKINTLKVKGGAPNPTTNTTKATSTPYPTVFNPTSVPEPTNPPVDVSYDESRGNNYIASKYAVDIQNTANKAVSGFITDSRIDLSPEDIGSKDEETYKKSIVSAFLQVEVNSSFWNQMSDDSKKDIVASLVTSMGNIFGGFPHITVSNGVRTVATGEQSTFSTELKIILK